MKTKEQKQQEAKKRQEAREARTLAEQMKLIETRPGESKKERARIKARNEKKP